MNANFAERPSTSVPGAKPPERGNDHLSVARPAVKDKRAFERHRRAIVAHEGALLAVTIGWEDRVRLQSGDRVCVPYVPATGYAGRCRNGRLDAELRRGAVVGLVIASFARLCLPIFFVLWRSGRIRPGVPVTLPPRPREPR